LAKCSFCGRKIKIGTGKMLVTKSGLIKYFCSRKCEKNFHMGRDPKRTKWTEIFRKKE